MSREYLCTKPLNYSTIIRKEKERVNMVNLYIPDSMQEKEFYLKQNGKKIFLFTEQTKNTIKKEVKKNAGTAQRYINLRNEVPHPASFKIYKTDSGYELEEMAPLEKKPRNGDTSKLGANHGIVIPKKYLYRMNVNESSYFLIEEHYDPLLYIRIRVISEEESKSYTDMTQKKLCNKMRKTDAKVILRKTKTITRIYMNRFFLEKSGMKIGDKVNFHFDYDGSLIMEIPDKHCDICGRPIRVASQSWQTLEVCDSCEGTVKILKKYSKNTRNLKDIREQVSEIQKQFVNLYESVKQEEK